MNKSALEYAPRGWPVIQFNERAPRWDATHDFMAFLFDRKIYAIGATETPALCFSHVNAENCTVYPADPWGLGGVNDRHTHFTGALFEFNTVETLKFRRLDYFWRGQVCIVLDDVGETKEITGKDGVRRQITIKAPPVKPTAIIETKPNSQQWIYAFNRVETDRQLVASIIASAQDAEMCDPAAGGISRLSRLPDRKPHGKQNMARLIWADWSRRFDPEKLIELGFQVPKIEASNVSPLEFDLPIFTSVTTPAGSADLDDAIAKILNALGITGSSIIYGQSFRIGLAVGNAQIATDDAERALLAAAKQRTPDGARQAKNGLRDGISQARPVSPQMQAEIDAAKVALDNLLTTGQGRKVAAKAVKDFLTATMESHASAHDAATPLPAPFHALFTSTGIGKTHAIIDALRDVLTKNPEYYVAFAVPMHRLSEEIKARIRKVAKGLDVVIKRGPNVDNPEKPHEKMCRNLEEFEEHTELLLNVEKSLCDVCEFKTSCAYLDQRDQSGQIVIITHQKAQNKPLGQKQNGGRKLLALVVDESPAQDPSFRKINIQTLRNDYGKFSIAQSIDLDFYRSKLINLIEAAQVGPIGLADIRAAGITAADCGEAIKLEWARKIEDINDPRVINNKSLSRLAGNDGIWQRLLEYLNHADDHTAPLYRIEVTGDNSGLLVHKASSIHADYTDYPILQMDATGTASALTHFYGDHAKLAEITTAFTTAPMLEITQDFSAEFGTSWANPEKARDKRNAGIASDNAAKLAAHVNSAAKAEKVLLITNKATKAEVGPHLVENVKIDNFGNLRGVDEFGKLKRGFIVGRPMPWKGDMRKHCIAVLGRPPLGGFGTVNTVRAVTGANGVVDFIRATRAGYPDDAQATELLDQIVTAELIQMIGRLRAVNSEIPVKITIFGSTVLSLGQQILPVSQAITWLEQMRPCPFVMQAEAGPHIFTGKLAAMYYPALWSSPSAAQSALHRHSGGCPKCGFLKMQTSIDKNMTINAVSGPISKNANVYSNTLKDECIFRDLTIYGGKSNRGGQMFTTATGTPDTIAAQITKRIGKTVRLKPTTKQKELK